MSVGRAASSTEFSWNSFRPISPQTEGRRIRSSPLQNGTFSPQPGKEISKGGIGQERVLDLRM